MKRQKFDLQVKRIAMTATLVFVIALLTHSITVFIINKTFPIETALKSTDVFDQRIYIKKIGETVFFIGAFLYISLHIALSRMVVKRNMTVSYRHICAYFIGQILITCVTISPFIIIDPSSIMDYLHPAISAIPILFIIVCYTCYKILSKK